MPYPYLNMENIVAEIPFNLSEMARHFHMYLCLRPHAPFFGRKLFGASELCGVCVAKGAIVPTAYGYCLIRMPWKAGCRCFCSVGDSLFGCEPTCLLPVVPMLPVDVCYSPQHNVVKPTLMALRNGICCWPGGPAESRNFAR